MGSSWVAKKSLIQTCRGSLGAREAPEECWCLTVPAAVAERTVHGKHSFGENEDLDLRAKLSVDHCPAVRVLTRVFSKPPQKPAQVHERERY